MKIGMTGNRDGISHEAKESLKVLLMSINPSEVHHGDCVGADEAFHNICEGLIDIVIHPPTNSSNRAFCENAKEIYETKSYLARNKDIVNNSELLIGLPSSDIEYLRSGTWSTIRFARTLKRPILIILPTGLVLYENCDNLRLNQ